jgi:hypothetical protein
MSLDHQGDLSYQSTEHLCPLLAKLLPRLSLQDLHQQSKHLTN